MIDSLVMGRRGWGSPLHLSFLMVLRNVSAYRYSVSIVLLNGLAPRKIAVIDKSRL